MEVTQFSVPVEGVDKKKAFIIFLLSNVKEFIPAGGGGQRKKIMW